MARPPIGAEIKTTEGMTAKVLKELGSGGQGTVYMVDYGGKKMALKWYHDSAFADPKTGAVDAEKREKQCADRQSVGGVPVAAGDNGI